MKHFYVLLIRTLFTRSFTAFEFAGFLVAARWITAQPDAWWAAVLCFIVWVFVNSVLEVFFADVLDDDTADVVNSDVLIEFNTENNTWTATRVTDGEVIAQGPDPAALAADMIKKLKE